MNQNQGDWDEQHVASLLAAANHDVTSPDSEFLNQLRQRSSEAFVESSSGTSQHPLSNRRPIARSGFALAAVAASIAVAAALFCFSPNESDARSFGRVLDAVAQADTLHLKVMREDKPGEIWTRQPQQLRWDNPDGTYRIADGGQVWFVDESANRATPQSSNYFSSDVAGLNLLALLGLDNLRSQRQVRTAQPVETINTGGRDFRVYRIQAAAEQGGIQLEALVDPNTNFLHLLKAKAARNGRERRIGELRVLAFNQPVADEMFVVSDTLTEDGRIGKVTDSQGIVAIKPVMQRRWTPVCRQMVLKPGDWLRTDLRGANAVSVRLAKHSQVTLGPGTLVTLIKPDLIHLVRGEVQVAAAKGAALELIGPNQQKVAVDGKQFYRLDERKNQLHLVAKQPLWLQGFEGSTSDESIGSLIAKVDGRNVPLTVGYHKVNVDIRDQIARTVIEESFVNHTDSQLEGVFYFPLPQDASISGFGMWIGNNLVEADVVEKQRAREIYETILRERRDPGLLEWSGGNIFKARVFPILAHSEKRIKITYTQVLPLKGNRYRYSYGLRSELLKQHPLRQLDIDVKVNSVMPLKSVASRTHTTRIDQTSHSAHVEFNAQEYTPTRDFEVTIEVDGQQSDVVLIPHRRGDDGYFMLLLTPPSAGGRWQREILPDGEALQLLILADTSASMDAEHRQTQAQFIATLLSSLTAKDKFNLAGCDVDCDWTFPQPASADDKNVTAARDFLVHRRSLGWTDLDKAFASVLKQAGPKTHVIYVGDGIVTTGDADPVAFGKRLRRLHRALKKLGTFHAVSVGSSFESVVLKAIAALGGGSQRQIGGERSPQAVALELLSEISQPGLRDLKVEFRGLRTARVYPEELPNVAAGSQQILLGRYLPEGRGQSGEVVVTGLLGDKPVKFNTQVSLKDAEHGNSFIPRLWARMHIDSLLDQGTSAAIKDDIIGLSEEYHIMTPYTSLLVLESDADRERFKVKRRFQMRDGEKFFAEGRDNANYELVQQQMKRAGNWRLGLRRRVLRQLAALGRDMRMFQAQQPYQSFTNSETARLPGIGGGGGLRGLGLRMHNYYDFDGDGIHAWDLGRSVEDLFLDGKNSEELGDRSPLELDLREGSKEGFKFEMADLADFPSTDRGETSTAPYYLGDEAQYFPSASEPESRLALGLNELNTRWFAGTEIKKLAASNGQMYGGGLWADGSVNFSRVAGPLAKTGLPKDWPSDSNQYTQWVNSLFPSLPPAPSKVKVRQPKPTWLDAARKLSNSLLRTDKLAKVVGGIEITRRTDTFNARWQTLSSQTRWLELVSPNAWLTRTRHERSQSIVKWCDQDEYGTLSEAFQLGRVRESVSGDLSPPPLSLVDFSLQPIEKSYAGYGVVLKPQGKDPQGRLRMLLLLKHPTSLRHETRVLIDSSRNVILSIRHRTDGKTTTTKTFDDFVEVAGCWWARRIETTDAEGRRSSLVIQTIKPLDAAAFNQRFQQQLSVRGQIQFIHQPAPKLSEAKQAVATAKANFDHQFLMLLHFARSQQWDRVLEHLQQCERLAAGKPGLRWVRNYALRISRRREELKQRFIQEAEGLAIPPANGHHPDELFLIDHLWGQASGFFEANEMLALLNRMRPVYERQPEHLQSVKSWRTQRVNYLSQTGQVDETLKLRKQLATDYPRDYQLQQQYATDLANSGEYTAAYAWLNAALAKQIRWSDYEKDSLHMTYTRLLRQQGRIPELAQYLLDWVKQNPPRSSAYEPYLSALIRNDQINEANALIANWMKVAQVAGQLESPVASRLNAAVTHALGQGYNMHSNRIDERWHAPLAEVVLFFARHETESGVADRIMRHWHFQRTDACRRVRKIAVGILLNEMDELTQKHIGRFVNWVMTNDPAVEKDVWKQIAAGLQKRWTAENKPTVKDQLAKPLVQILTSRVGAEELLAFLRMQLSQATERYETAYAHELFNALLSQPWTAGYENEAFKLLEQLSNAEEPDQRLVVQVGALHRLTDRMVKSRYDALMKKVEHPEKLTRIELRQKKTDNLKLARTQFADRLATETPQRPQAFANWLNIERLYLDVLIERNLKRVAEECWELLGDGPPKPTKPIEELTIGDRLTQALRGRMLLTLANLSIRKDADAALVDRLFAYIGQGSKTDPDNTGWKLLTYQLLIALDRPKQLEQALVDWIRSDDPANHWRLSLAFLRAELGQIDEAIKLFEAVESDDELGPRDYRMLAGLYMVVDRRNLHDRSLIEMYKTMQEYRLSRSISTSLNPWQRTDRPLPSELNKDVLLVFAALFEKSASPQNYVYQIRQFYQACHDFRLLSVLADGVVGHTAKQVYPFLKNMQSVLTEVRDEATADSIVEHLAEVRRKAKTAVDHRALDLLELMVERRSSEVLNQPGPHVQKALAAMQRAFKREWSDGEPRLMADFLASLGRMSQPPLAQEQLRQLQTLHRQQAAGSLDRLHIAHHWARSLWDYQRHGESIDLLQSALDEYQDASGGTLPSHANEVLITFVSFLENRGHFARGETVLIDQLGRPANRQQRLWLTQRLYRLYRNALQSSGQVSLGSGMALYKALERRLLDDLNTDDQNHRYSLIGILCNVYSDARNKKLTGVIQDLKAFAFQRLPEVLKRQTNNYTSIVTQVASTVRNVAGLRDGLAFLIERIEDEPAWFRYNNQDGWSQHSWTLSRWRSEIKNLGNLEDRLLKVVTAELRRDLQSRQARVRYMYHRQHNYFWQEKTDDFARTAESVLAERKQSGAAVQYIADYFYRGLHRYGRAIAVLFEAHKAKRLNESGRAKLVDFLHRQSRFRESIALLEPLIELRPANLNYRVQLMRAYFRTKRPNNLLALLKQTDAFFHEENRWTENALAGLGKSCLDNELFQQSVAYYNELIPRHQRSQPRRGIGNGTLSTYYAQLAEAYSALKETSDAVDAACGAIVSWGPRHRNRANALETLKKVLRQSADLDGYVNHLNKQFEETALHNPIVRKALGLVYFGKTEYAKAIVQLKLAIELQPNDIETHKTLISCYDRQNNKQAAIAQLIQSLQLNRRDIELYRDLARKFAQLDQPRQVERAYASIVEVLPNESESHAALAEVRQKQNRWDDAILHWNRVAEIRSLEPTGLLKLAAAQIRRQKWDQAKQTVRKLNARSWPSRFSNVRNKIRNLERQVEQAREK